jgi:chemotaxis protein MotB
MKKITILAISALFLFPSCVSTKKHNELKKIYQENKDLLNTATVKLNSCLSEQAAAESSSKVFQARFEDMKKTNNDLIQRSKDLTMLTAKGATNLEKSLESLQERDLKITRLQDAISKKDSVTLALVTSLKKEVGINDPDIEINVEKGVVFISIADKLLFKSGSYNVTTKANIVLGKVATVVNGKPDFECMVEGHTDNIPYKSGVLLDNWDLSVKRSTAIVRKLESLGVTPDRLIAAGRSHYVPLVPNDTRENRSKNRRTRIVVLPKIDQFYDMIEKEMKSLSEGE